MGWLIALGVIVLLGLLPLGISAAYNANGLFLKVIAGPVRITLIPANKKEKQKTRKPKKPKKIADTSGQKPKDKQSSKTGGSFADFLPLVKIVFDFLYDFRRKLRVDRLEMKLVLAGGDPCDLSINYGRAWTALGNLMPQLERIFVIKKRDLEIECDYVSDNTVIYARLDATITLGRLLFISFHHGGRGLFKFIKIMNQRKGGAEQ